MWDCLWDVSSWGVYQTYSYGLILGLTKSICQQLPLWVLPRSRIYDRRRAHRFEGSCLEQGQTPYQGIVTSYLGPVLKLQLRTNANGTLEEYLPASTFSATASTTVGGASMQLTPCGSAQKYTLHPCCLRSEITVVWIPARTATAS